MYKKYVDGWIEVITGPMFSGKSEELIKRVKVLEYAKANILIIKPKVDNRGTSRHISSRNGTFVKTKLAKNVNDIHKLLTSKYDVLVIDEAQFFSNEIITYCNKKANDGLKIIVSGLDQNYLGKPFGPIPQLLALAEFVTKLTAICFRCHLTATMTYRKSKKGKVVEIGDSNLYEARCRACHFLGMQQNN